MFPHPPAVAIVCPSKCRPWQTCELVARTPAKDQSRRCFRIPWLAAQQAGHRLHTLDQESATRVQGQRLRPVLPKTPSVQHPKETIQHRSRKRCRHTSTSPRSRHHRRTGWRECRRSKNRSHRTRPDHKCLEGGDHCSAQNAAYRECGRMRNCIEGSAG